MRGPSDVHRRLAADSISVSLTNRIGTTNTLNCIFGESCRQWLLTANMVFADKIGDINRPLVAVWAVRNKTSNMMIIDHRLTSIMRRRQSSPEQTPAARYRSLMSSNLLLKFGSTVKTKITRQSDYSNSLDMTHTWCHNSCFHHNARLTSLRTLMTYYFVLSFNGEETLNKCLSPDQDPDPDRATGTILLVYYNEGNRKNSFWVTHPDRQIDPNALSSLLTGKGGGN